MEMKEHVGFSCATGGSSGQQAPFSLPSPLSACQALGIFSLLGGCIYVACHGD